MSIDRATFHSPWRPWRDTPTDDLEHQAVVHRRALADRDARRFVGFAVHLVVLLVVSRLCASLFVGSGFGFAQRLAAFLAVYVPSGIFIQLQIGGWWGRNLALTRHHKRELEEVLAELDVRRIDARPARLRHAASWAEMRQRWHQFFRE